MLERIKEFKFQKSAPQKQINSSLQNTGLQIAQELPDDICNYTIQCRTILLLTILIQDIYHAKIYETYANDKVIVSGLLS
jgi:hypothetical protein